MSRRLRRAAAGVAAAATALVPAAGAAESDDLPKPVRMSFEVLDPGVPGPLLDVSFVDRDRGFAVGTGPLILSTADGGRTWQAKDVNLPPHERSGKPQDKTLTAVNFPDPQHGYAVGAAIGPRVLATGDGGQTWEPREFAPRPSDVGEGFTDRDWGGFFDVMFTDRDRGHAVTGGSGAIFATADGGRSWSWQGNREYGTLTALSFVDAQYGWAVGPVHGTSFVAIATADGGASWTKQEMDRTGLSSDISATNFRAVTFVDAQHGWVVRDGGEIFATADGGRTWKMQRSGTTEQFYAVAFADDSRGVVVGNIVTDTSKALILATNNGGQTWTSRLLRNISHFWNVDFADRDTAYAVGCEDRGPNPEVTDPAADKCVKAAAVRISFQNDDAAAGDGNGPPWLLLAGGGAALVVLIGVVMGRRRSR